MLKFLRLFFKNLYALGTIDLMQMIVFEQAMLEHHNHVVEDIKGVNFILRREHGYDTGIFLPRRPGHIDVLTRVNRPLTIPMAIATEVENTLICQEQERLARANYPAANPVPVEPPLPTQSNHVRKPKRKRRRTK